jgi:hypothetical protein
LHPIRGRLRRQVLPGQPGCPCLGCRRTQPVNDQEGSCFLTDARDLALVGSNSTDLLPAVAISHDAGATWVLRSLPGTTPAVTYGERGEVLDPNATRGFTSMWFLDAAVLGR